MWIEINRSNSSYVLGLWWNSVLYWKSAVLPVKISILEDLDIRSDEVQEIVRLNPKIAKALVKLGIDHKNKEHELGQNIEKKIYEGGTTFPGEIVSDFIQKFENYFTRLEEFATNIYDKVKINNRTR